MQRKNNRPTIGFLVSQLIDEYSVSIWSAIAAEAEKHDVNLVCLIGGALNGELNFEYQRNSLYDLINNKKIDGLILAANQLSQLVGTNELKKLIRKYHPLPVVNIGVDIDNYPCILTDNKAGMRDVMVHLIEVHGYKKIAFICGPENSQEAVLRYEAYKDVLSEYNIEFNAELIMEGDFQRGSYGKEFSEYINKDLKYEAVVSSNDYMAVRMMDELKEKNIRIPDDVAVTGFDYNEQSRSVAPKLTTVSQPKYDIGITAFNTMLALLNNQKVPAKQMLPTKLIIQQSCGCTKTFEPAVYNKRIKNPRANHSLSHEERELIINVIEREIGLHCIRLTTKERRLKWA
ncbi:MAG: substrate-binding domain-containing protein, partial [Spirochaetia bacterium]